MTVFFLFLFYFISFITGRTKVNFQFLVHKDLLIRVRKQIEFYSMKCSLGIISEAKTFGDLLDSKNELEDKINENYGD